MRAIAGYPPVELADPISGRLTNTVAFTNEFKVVIRVHD